MIHFLSLLVTQDIDIIISSIYIWENLSMENLGKVLTVTLLTSEAKAWVIKICPFSKFFSFLFLKIFYF